MPGCFVRGCLSRWGRKDEDYSLHVFPKDISLTKRWLQQLGIPHDEIEELVGKVKERKQGSFRICSKHFAKECYEKRHCGWTLKKGSIPTLFLQDESEPDHAYAKKQKLEGAESSEQSEDTMEQLMELEEDTEVASFDSSSEPESSPSVLIISETIKDSSTVESTYLQNYEEVVHSIACTEETEVEFCGESSRAKKICKKRHVKSVGTCTEYFPGQVHKSTQFRRFYATKNKRSQVCRRPSHRSIGVQCNLEKKVEEPPASRYYLSKYASLVRDKSSTDHTSMEIDSEFNVNSPFCSSVTDNSSDSEPAFSDSELGPPKKKEIEICMPTKTMEEDSIRLETEVTPVDTNDSDNSWHLLENVPNDRSQVKENKLIVFESCLDELLLSCKCKANENCTGSIVKLEKYRTGTAISVTAYCSKDHKFNLWQSQPLIGRTPVGNLLLSAGILCSGANFLRVERLLNFMGILGISRKTYLDNQNKYLFPTINYHWEKNHLETLEEMQNTPVALAGEGQFLSSANRAQNCIYSFLDSKSKKIVDFQIEQQQPGMNAAPLETKAFHGCLQRLRASNINVRIVCTDFRTSLRKLTRDIYKDIKHLFDVSHVSEYIGNKIAIASKQKCAAGLAHWVDPTKKHLWWCAQVCNQNPLLLQQKWSSIVYHVVNQHQWQANTQYKNCHHAPLRPEEEQTRLWLSPGSAAHNTFKKIVLNPRFLKTIEHSSSFSHTEELEVFHNLSLKYRSNENHNSLDSLIARTQLAALDHNKNIGRMQTVVHKATSHGREIKSAHVCLSSKKSKKKWVVENEFDPTCEEFILEIIQDVLELAKGNKSYPWQSHCNRELQSIATVPPPGKSAFNLMVTV